MPVKIKDTYIQKATSFLDRVVKELQVRSPNIGLQLEMYLIYTTLFAMLFKEIAEDE